MPILKEPKLFRISPLILVSLLILTTLTPNAYCDDWVFLFNNAYVTEYYNSTTINIDKHEKIIKVWTKLVNKQQIGQLGYSLILRYFNYKENTMSINNWTMYSKSGNVLEDFGYPYKWQNIESDESNMMLLNKLIEDYNIKR